MIPNRKLATKLATKILGCGMLPVKWQQEAGAKKPGTRAAICCAFVTSVA
jgi:hypothetical protein